MGTPLLTDPKEKLSQEVQQWYLKELNGKNNGLPCPNLEAIRTICRGEMMFVFQFLIQNIRSKRLELIYSIFQQFSTIFTIRENIMLNGSNDNQTILKNKKKKLIERRNHLRATLQEKNDHIQKISREIEHLHLDFEKESNLYQTTHSSIKEIKFKKMILDTCLKKLDNFCRVLKEYQKRIKEVKECSEHLAKK